ncbi:hypothetical protein JCM10207_001773 [Rhodosporidiobolus poonsookiae]
MQHDEQHHPAGVPARHEPASTSGSHSPHVVFDSSLAVQLSTGGATQPSAAISIPSTSSTIALPSSSLLNRPPSNFPTSSSRSPSSSPPAPIPTAGSGSPPRHHTRTCAVVAASHIPPRELRWRCREEEGMGLQLGGGEAGRSWDDEAAAAEGEAAEAIRAVHDETVRVERADGSPPSPSSPTSGLVRKRSLYGDPDSPD